MLTTLAAAIAVTPASAQEVSVVAGGGVSSGEYGSDRETLMASANLGLRWSDDDTTVTLSLPYVAIRSPGIVFAGFDGTPLVMLADAGGRRTSREGVGDPTLSVSQRFRIGEFALRGTARLKAAVQDYNDVSTGETDWSVGAELSRPFGSITPFAGVSYRSYGDPEQWTIRDGFAATVGVSAPVGPGALAVSYDVAETTSDFVDDAHEILAAYDVGLRNSRMRLAAYGTVGLSDGAPGLGAGIRLSVPL